ncbi:MAG: PQQ-binding-like beta-propeller repeat protein, partial [Acidovorax sp.]
MRNWMNSAGSSWRGSVTSRDAMVLALAAASLFATAATSAMAEQAKGSKAHIAAVTKKVDGAFIRANEARTSDWPSHGLDYAETRFSRLNQISTANVKDLGLVWSYNLESTRGVEATPLVVDGIMYVTASWSIVHAIDVRSGKKIWTYDPKVPRDGGYKGCCDV